MLSFILSNVIFIHCRKTLKLCLQQKHKLKTSFIHVAIFLKWIILAKWLPLTFSPKLFSSASVFLNFSFLKGVKLPVKREFLCLRTFWNSNFFKISTNFGSIPSFQEMIKEMMESRMKEMIHRDFNHRKLILNYSS